MDENNSKPGYNQSFNSSSTKSLLKSPSSNLISIKEEKVEQLFSEEDVINVIFIIINNFFKGTYENYVLK